MEQFGLIGYPLSHSFSKEYFTSKFKNETINASYDLFPIPSINGFPSIIDSHFDLVGLNVTIPYKQSIIPYLDVLDFEAKAMGAVNVIRVEKQANGTKKLIGFNTDLYGFRESIRPLVQQLKKRINDAAQDEVDAKKPLQALVLGTGGASKAVLYGLEQLGIKTLTVSRTSANGQLTYDELTAEHYQTHQIIVNTTPLGMHPNVDICPELDYHRLGTTHLLYDVVYNPDMTRFLTYGEKAGCLLKNGLEMLHLQADAAWIIWNKP